MHAMSGSVDVSRAWDTGTTAGMTRPGSADGQVRKGRTARVTTGAGVVRTDKWVRGSLGWGEVDHVGLESIQNTLSSGQHNAELGVETSWLAPSSPGPLSDCGTCVLHRADGGHVVWSGAHQVERLRQS